jgi:uncharacterized protein YdcH (DUF465 family)
MDLKSKKIIRDYIYHLETLDDIKQISSVAEGEFRDAMNSKDPNALNALSTEEKPKVQEEIESINHNDSKFKKLFRKAAVRCHPDKYNQDEYSNVMKASYELLTKANDDYDWGLLLKVCLDLDVEVTELEDSEINNIINKTEELKKSIHKYETSMAYSWYSLNDETRKNEYLAECAKIFNKFLGN